MATKPSAWSLLPAEWKPLCKELGLPAFRAEQIVTALYQNFAQSWQEITTLPAGLRDALAERFTLAPLETVQIHDSPDGVRKLLLACEDGERIETVLIPSKDRVTQCLSTQVGCAFGCAFCASGAAGVVRDLTAGEIVAEVMAACQLLRPSTAATPSGASPFVVAPSGASPFVVAPSGASPFVVAPSGASPFVVAPSGASHPRPGAKPVLPRPGNIVVMGMGEPFANYDNTLRALRILNDQKGVNIGARHITLSTCGVVPGIRRLAEEGLQFELSVSLHAPNDALRDRIMPVNKRWPIAELLGTCASYTEKTGRVVTFEYTLVKDFNDRPLHADELIRLLRHIPCKVNLIPLSPTEGFAGERPDDRACLAFLDALLKAKINTTLRKSRGKDVDAACGQLRLRCKDMPPFLPKKR
jgi:23S rRNA (adenine2503-C2)-methyltransferase